MSLNSVQSAFCVVSRSLSAARMSSCCCFNSQIISEVTAEGHAIVYQFREVRAKHLQNISETKSDPLLSVTYMNMLNSYRRIKDHIENVAEALAGEK